MSLVALVAGIAMKCLGLDLSWTGMFRIAARGGEPGPQASYLDGAMGDVYRRAKLHLDATTVGYEAGKNGRAGKVAARGKRHLAESQESQAESLLVWRVGIQTGAKWMLPVLPARQCYLPVVVANLGC